MLRPRHFRAMMSALATRLFQFDYAELLDIRHSETKQQRYYEQFSQWEKLGIRSESTLRYINWLPIKS